MEGTPADPADSLLPYATIGSVSRGTSGRPVVMVGLSSISLDINMHAW